MIQAALLILSALVWIAVVALYFRVSPPSKGQDINLSRQAKKMMMQQAGLSGRQWVRFRKARKRQLKRGKRHDLRT